MSGGDYARRRKNMEGWYQDLVLLARKGDKRAADTLLASFAALSSDPDHYDQAGGIPTALLQHVATCIADWRKRSYVDAETWFWIERPNHRPTAWPTRQEIRALRAYRLLVARGKGTTAARAGAAIATGIAEDRVRYLVEKKNDDLERRVLLFINPRLHHRILNPPRKKYQRTR